MNKCSIYTLFPSLLPEAFELYLKMVCFLCSKCLLLWLFCGYLDWLTQHSPWEVFMIANLAKRFLSLPSNISFHLQPQAGPCLFLWSQEYKDMGPSGLTRRALCQSLPPHLCSLSHQAAGPIAVNQVTTPRQ